MMHVTTDDMKQITTVIIRITEYGVIIADARDDTNTPINIIIR